MNRCSFALSLTFILTVGMSLALPAVAAASELPLVLAYACYYTAIRYYNLLSVAINFSTLILGSVCSDYNIFYMNFENDSRPQLGFSEKRNFSFPVTHRA